MNRRSVGAALALALLVPLGSVHGGRGVKDPDDWIRKGKPERAFEIWKERAEAGEAKAQYRLGNMYMLGLGTKRDEDEVSTS